MVVLDPVAHVARVQLTEVLPVLLQLQPPFDGVTDTNVTPAGRVSATLTLLASDGPRLLTLRLYEIVPAALTAAGPVLTTDRSASGVTVVLTLALLLPGTGSTVVVVAVAVLVIVPPWFGAVTTIVKVVLEPTFQFGRVQLTEALPALVQVQPPLLGVVDPNVTPGGRLSLMTTLDAFDGPLFVAVTVYVSDPAALTVAGPDLVMARSACGITLVLTVSLLLPGVGSAVVPPIVAPLVSVAPCAGAVTTTVMVVLAPVFHAGRVQVTEMLALLLHVQPPLLGVTETNVTPAGSVSVTVMFAESDGPLFATSSV